MELGGVVVVVDGNIYLGDWRDKRPGCSKEEIRSDACRLGSWSAVRRMLVEFVNEKPSSDEAVAELARNDDVRELSRL